MRIEELKLTSFRGFKELSMRLHPQMNLIVGVNGAGKSTILDAIATVLRSVIFTIENGSFPEMQKPEKDFRV